MTDAGTDGSPALSLDDRRISEWLFILTFVVCGYFYAGGGWNQNSQFDLTRAIVERHTFAIDAYRGNTGDVSRHGDHTYSNKSPGLSWLGAIPYALLHAAERSAGVNPGDARVLALNHYLCSLAVVVPFAAAIPAMLYRFGRRRALPARWCAIVALTAALATQNLPYSTFFILHVPSGALMLFALLGRRHALSGFAAGLATVTNYLCAPAVILFALIRGKRGALFFLAGSAVPLAALAAYQRICFGAFSTVSIAKEDPRFLSEGAVMGVFGLPSIEALYGITVSPYRGLFYFAPVLVMAIAGMVYWRERGLLAVVVAVSVVFFGFNVCFNGWEGGFGIGARYLVPLIPLWGLALLHARPRGLVAALGVVSLAINFTAAAVDPQPSGTIPRPLTQYLFPLLVHGTFSSDVPITRPWSAETFTGHTSVNRLAHDEAIVFTRHAPGSVVAEWSSFNLGEPFWGPGDLRSLLPILAFLVAGIATILHRAGRLEPAAQAAAPRS